MLVRNAKNFAFKTAISFSYFNGFGNTTIIVQCLVLTICGTDPEIYYNLSSRLNLSRFTMKRKWYTLVCPNYLRNRLHSKRTLLTNGKMLDIYIRNSTHNWKTTSLQSARLTFTNKLQGNSACRRPSQC